MKLYPHQSEGAAWLAKLPRAGLLDEQGVGKTITAIEAAAQVFDRVWGYSSDPERVLVICPSVVLWNWEGEFNKWAPVLKVQVVDSKKTTLDDEADVVVVTHGLLLAPRIQAQLLRRRWMISILDEAHFFRNHEAARTQAFYGADARLEEDTIVGRSDRAWILTGTPMPNDASELWTHFRGLWPERIANEIGEPMSFFAFRRRFCFLRQTLWGVKVTGNKKDLLPELRAKLQGVTMRRRLRDVLPDLPRMRFEVFRTKPETMPWQIGQLSKELSPKVLKTCRENMDKIREEGETPDALDGFAALKGSTDFSAFRRLCGLAKADAVADLLNMELESGALGKVVVFAHHADVVARLIERLGPERCVRIVGATSARDRRRAELAFQGKPEIRVAVCNIIAGGTGVTLTAAHEVAFVELSFVPGENAQAASRCLRIGQDHKVRARVFSLAGTVDEAVAATLTKKTEMIREVLQ